MGFDNECILNIQSLPGEYFCPVCRTLIYPNEALQSQCTHLYCKPCLAYIVATTYACPYDGYLVTEADSKPLMESNKALAETIGKVAVHCLYHRSGCQWQGTLSECITHCTGCNFGNSSVVCNRCGTQIIHRQVQEHAQICPGLLPQAQQIENAQVQAASAPSQAVAQDPSSAALATPATTAPSSATATTAASSATATTTAPTATASSAPASVPAVATGASGQAQVQGSAVVYPQAMAQAPTPEQWYQQQQLQYQQYYQQYDPYQQQYQQYAQYQQQAHPQYMQPHIMQAAPQHVIPGQQQPQPYMQQPQSHIQPQPQPQPQPQAHAQVQPQAQPLPQPQPQAQAAQPQLQQQHVPQPQLQPQPQPQPQSHLPAQVPHMQAQLHVPAQQPHPQAPQTHPPPHGQLPQPHHPHPQPHAQALPPPSQHQQPVPLQQHPSAQLQHLQPHFQHQPPPQNPPPTHPHPQPQPQIQQPHMQLRSHPQPHPHAQPHPQTLPQSQPLHPPAHAVSGYQSYPQPIPGAPQHRSMHMHPQQQCMPPQHPQNQSQFPPQQSHQMRPPHAQMPIQVQQQPAMPPPQGPDANLHPPQQQVQHLAHQPGQPINQHPVMQPRSQHHSFPPQQAQGHMHPGLPQQQGAVPPQHQMHPQQSLRPQGPAYIHQHIPGQPHSQLNVPSAQGLPASQAQARPMMLNHGMPQQPVQLSPGGGPRLMQPGVNQQSPNQNHLARTTTHLAPSSELQPGSMQQSQLPPSGSQSALVPASPATPKQRVSMPDKVGHLPQSEAGVAAKNARGSGSAEEIPERVSDSKSMGDEEKATAAVKEDTQPDNDGKDILESAQVLGKGLKSLVNDENVDGPLIKQVKEEEAANTLDEEAESSHALKVARGDKEIIGHEGQPDEISGARVEGEGAHPLQDATRTVRSLPGSNKAAHRESLSSNIERTNQGSVFQGQIAGIVANNMQAPLQMPALGGLERGQLQQPTHQNALPAHERGFPHPGYHDRNLSQFPQQHAGSDDHRGMPPAGPLPNQERCPPQHFPYGRPPNMQDPAVVSQRPPAPDRMFPQPMPQSSQERRFLEVPPHPMQVHGQTMATSQMRPPGHNFPETFPHQGLTSVAPEPFWPPPHAGVPGPGLPPHSASIPGHHGFPQKSFEQQIMAPQGQTQGHMPPPYAGGARTAPGEPLARPVMGGPPPGAFDTPSGMMVGGPPFVPEDKANRSAPVNAVEAEAYAIKRSGVYDGRQLESRRPLLTEHVPYGQPSVTKVNGIPSKAPGSRMPDSAFAHGSPEDRFKPLPEGRFKSFPEEGFKAAHDERFRPYPLDPGRHIVNRREFEEDLKQFPRPAHLDGEGVPKFGGYVSSSRPLDRGPQQFGLDAVPRPFDRASHGPDGSANALTLRPVPPGAPFPPSSGGSEVHLDIGERGRPVTLHEHLGGKHDPNVAHPDHLRLVPEFGRHHMDSLPPLRSPGREYTVFSSSRFGLGGQSRTEEFDGRDPHGFGERLKALNLPSDPAGSTFHDSKIPMRPGPGHFIRDIPDGPGSLRMEQLRRGLDSQDVLHAGGPLGHGSSSNIRSGETFRVENLPSHLQNGASIGQRGEIIGFGGFRSHLGMSEPGGPGNLPSRLRIGDLGFNGSYPMHGLSDETGHFNLVSRQGDIDTFEQSRKRKPGSMGWCRICKIDCETVEGLDLHSQTREHQKMAMDMVLSIKKDSAKKHKLSSENTASFEGANKSRKASFENRGNRQ